MDQVITCESSVAGRRAEGNWLANRAALGMTQPWLDVDALPLPGEVEWVLGRDGQLTARVGERWLAGCSVPRLAGERMLRELKLDAATGCLLRPMHASHVALALAQFRRQQALLVVVDDLVDAAMLLRCEDLSREIRGHRLWLALGEDWEQHLEQVLRLTPGLPIPGQYLRTAHLKAEAVAPLITRANQVFGRLTRVRQELAKQLAERAAGGGRATRVCVMMPSQFRMWEDTHYVMERLRETSAGVMYSGVDPDDPAMSSPIALGLAARDCDALLMANMGRSDMATATIPLGQPVLSWVTTPRIPAPVASAGRDGLILADPQLKPRALELGWKEERVRVAGWPERSVPESAGQAVGLIADTESVRLPEGLKDLSSLQVLCDFIQEQMHRNALVMGDDPAGYLRRSARRFGIAENTLDLAAMTEHVLVPCYQQNLARMLLANGVTGLRIWGKGWDACADLVDYWAGEIADEEQMVQVIGQCRVLVESWPTKLAHAMCAAGRPVVRTMGKSRDEVLRQIARPMMQDNRIPAISEGVIAELLG